MNAPPQCPRQFPQAGFTDWITLNDARYQAFNVCPTCYNSQLRPTSYGNYFATRPVPPNVAIRCDLGRFWVSIAGMVFVLYNDDRRHDITLLPRAAAVAVTDGECPNASGQKQTATRMWYSIRDVQTGVMAMPGWQICPLCVVNVQMLFPAIANSFAAVGPGPSQGHCSFISHLPTKDQPTLQQLMSMGTCSANTMMSGHIDMSALLESVRTTAGISIGGIGGQVGGVMDGVCPRVVLSNTLKCHHMRDMFEFTVCERCYQEVVKPDADKNIAFAQNFAPTASAMPSGFTCQLYLDRMRRVWSQAVSTGNMEFLSQKVLERRAKERELNVKISSIRAEIEQLHAQAKAAEAMGNISMSTEVNRASNAMRLSVFEESYREDRYCNRIPSIQVNFDSTHAAIRQSTQLKIQASQLESQIKMAEDEWRVYWE